MGCCPNFHEVHSLIYANRKFYDVKRILKGIIFCCAPHRHVYGPISLHLTRINCYKLPIIPYLLRQELSGRVCKIIWKLNSELSLSSRLLSAHEGRNLLFISSLSLAPAFICTSSWIVCSDVKIMGKRIFETGHIQYHH